MTIKEYVADKKEKIKLVTEFGPKISLCIIQVGDNPASNSYIKGKLKDCLEVGIDASLVRLGVDIDTDYLVNMVRELSHSACVDGLIVQLPLPEHIDVEKVQQAIAPHRDVDGFNVMSEFVACTPLGVMNYLAETGYNFTGKNALVIGRSDIVGKPLAKLLTDANATVTLAHSKTPRTKLIQYIETADIVFTAIDKIEFYDMSYASCFENVPVIIDIGLGKSEQGKLKGNLSSELVKHLNEHGNFVISGIGGVGLLTRLQLLINTIHAKSPTTY